jgi:GH18 family chitinase
MNLAGKYERRLLIAAIVASASLLPAQDRGSKAPAAVSSRQAVIGYFTEGGAKSGHYTVKDLITSGAAERLTELDYAFGRVADNQCQVADPETALNHAYTAAESVNGQADPDGPGELRGTFHQLQELKVFERRPARARARLRALLCAQLHRRLLCSWDSRSGHLRWH